MQENYTGEIHIYQCHYNGRYDAYYAQSTCECSQASWQGGNRLEDSQVYNEKQMRRECAKIGRATCGRCVSTLYTTLTNEN